MTIVSSQEQPARLYSRWHLYFYVPGTKVVGGFRTGRTSARSAGKTVLEFTDKPGYFSVPVAQVTMGSCGASEQLRQPAVDDGAVSGGMPRVAVTGRGG